MLVRRKDGFVTVMGFIFTVCHNSVMYLSASTLPLIQSNSVWFHDVSWGWRGSKRDDRIVAENSP